MCQGKSERKKSEKVKQVRAGRRNMPRHVTVWLTSSKPFRMLQEWCVG